MLKTLENCAVLLCVPAIVLLGVYPKEIKSMHTKGLQQKIFAASLFIMGPN